MERDVILSFNEKNYFARTSFQADDLDNVVDQMREKYDDMQDDDALLRKLESNGYLKIAGSAPEIIEIWQKGKYEILVDSRRPPRAHEYNPLL